MDIGNLDQVHVEQEAVADRRQYLKEGVQVKAQAWGESIFSIELPQFLELMVAKVRELEGQDQPKAGKAQKVALLETGASVEVPSFIEVGDVIKIDTRLNEFVQRV